jgi:hypothetical protein
LADPETRLIVLPDKTIVLAPDIAHEDGVGMDLTEEVFIHMIGEEFVQLFRLFAKELEGVMELAYQPLHVLKGVPVGKHWVICMWLL